MSSMPIRIPDLKNSLFQSFSTERLFFYRLFPAFTGIAFPALLSDIVFSASCRYASKASAPYRNFGSAASVSVAGAAAAILTSSSFSSWPAWYCFTSAASRSVFSMAASARFRMPDSSFFCPKGFFYQLCF